MVTRQKNVLMLKEIVTVRIMKSDIGLRIKHNHKRAMKVWSHEWDTGTGK